MKAWTLFELRTRQRQRRGKRSWEGTRARAVWVPLTQVELAKRMGVSLRAWQRWEAGEREPRVRDVPVLASALDVGVGVVVRAILASRAQVFDTVREQAVIHYLSGKGEEWLRRRRVRRESMKAVRVR